MAITAAAVSAEPRSWSTGPLKQQIIDFSAASAATGGTATADSLTQVKWAIVTGVTQTAAPTFSGNVVTIAFVDPAATVYGQIICFGV
jgi:hypothetical protein